MKASFGLLFFFVGRIRGSFVKTDRILAVYVWVVLALLFVVCVLVVKKTVNVVSQNEGNVICCAESSISDVTNKQGDSIVATGAELAEESLTKFSLKDRFRTLIGTQGARVVWLGDSVSAGYTASNGEAWAFSSSLENAVGYPDLFHYALIYSDPDFIPVTAKNFEVTDVVGIPKWKLTEHDTVQVRLDNDGVQTDTLSLYVYENGNYSASRGAGTVEVVLSDVDGNAIQTNTVDTSTIYQNMGIWDHVDGRISRREISLSQTNSAYVATFHNVQAGRTATLFGFSFGNGVDFLNMAIASTTLTQPSEGNTARSDVSPAELRLIGETNRNANVWFIAWGANDSKEGVTTPSVFKRDYNSFIDDVYDFNSDAVVVLVTSPKGLTSYHNVSEYNSYIRDVARQRGLPLFDVEAVLNATDSSITYYDDIHPSCQGHRILAKELGRFAGVEVGNALKKSIREPTN